VAVGALRGKGHALRENRWQQGFRRDATVGFILRNVGRLSDSERRCGTV